MQIRYARRGEEFGEWKSRLLPSFGPRTLGRLFLNARENHLLACQSLLQQLELDFKRGVTHGVTSRLVENLALRSFPGDALAIDRATARQLQYRVVFSNGQTYLSPIYDMNVEENAK